MNPVHLYEFVIDNLIHISVRRRQKIKADSNEHNGYSVDVVKTPIEPSVPFGACVISFDAYDKNSCVLIRAENGLLSVVMTFDKDRIINLDVDKDYYHNPKLEKILRTVYDIMYSAYTKSLDFDYFHRMIEYPSLYIDDYNPPLTHPAYDHFINSKVLFQVTSDEEQSVIQNSDGGDSSKVIFYSEETDFELETSISKVEDFSRHIETKCSGMEFMTDSYVSMLSFIAITQLTDKRCDVGYTTNIIDMMYEPIKELANKFN